MLLRRALPPSSRVHSYLSRYFSKCHQRRVGSQLRQYSQQKRPTAAAIIIGNEILNGNILDTNTHYLANFLFKKGIDLKRVEVVPDEEDMIVESVRRITKQVDYTFTSGGIGPTHDDITYQAIAKAFNVPLEYHQETIDLMQKALGQEHLNEARKRMALLPKNATIVYTNKARWVPLAIINNVHILPGVPQLFRSMLEESDSLGLYKYGTQLKRVVIYTLKKEGDIAEPLRKLQEANPKCLIGSYPKFEGTNYNVMISIVGEDSSQVESVAKQLEESVPGFFRELPSTAVL